MPLSLIVVLLYALILSPMAIDAQGAALKDQLSVRESRSAAADQSSGRVTLDFDSIPLQTAILKIAQQARLKPSYVATIIPAGVKVSLQARDLPVAGALLHILKGTGLVAQIQTTGNLVIFEKDENSKDKDRDKDTVQVTIKGRVLDSATLTVISGAGITLVGTELSTVSGKDGDFVITNVPAGTYILTARLLGYRQSRDVRIVIENQESRNVTILMARSSTTLSEVVTTVTGPQRRVEVAHDIARIDAEKVMERSPVRSVTDLIEAAQVPGVLVSRASGDPGSPTKIRIRGLGSISQSNDPVIIVDGIWIDGSMGSPSRIDDIDPSTIESVEIVRGASAATLYGQDASNGVIVITTKKGKTGPTRWTFSYNRDWGQTYGAMQPQYMGLGYNNVSARRMGCSIEQMITFACIQDSVAVFDPNDPLLLREGTATNNRYVAQVDGGSENLRYALTATASNTIGVRRTSPVDMIRFRQLGFRPTSDFTKPSMLDRRNITSNMTLLPSDRLSISMTSTVNHNYLKDNSYGLETRSFIAGGIYSLDTLELLGARSTVSAVEKPVKTISGMIGVGVQWRPHSAWNVNANIGGENIVSEVSMYQANTSCSFGNPCMDTVGSIREINENRAVYTLRLNTSTSINFGRLNKIVDLRPSIGGDLRRTNTTRLQVERTNVPPGERTLQGEGSIYSRSSKIPNATAGWYLNSTVGLFRRIYFDVGIRQDIGSAIKRSSNTTYPKLGGSWLVSDEGFWRENGFVNLLRLRAALGHSAVQPDVTDVYGRYTHGYEYIGDRWVPSIVLSSSGNPSLQPERAVEMEVGLDADLLSNRVDMNLTYAQSHNKNTLISRIPPPSIGSGGGLSKENIARVRNRNLEMSTNVRAIEVNNALLTLNYTLTLSDNIVQQLGEGIMPFSNSTVGRINAGYPIAGVWAQRVIGYKDLNGDKMLARNEVIFSDSAVFVGSSQPRYRAGYGVSLTLNNRVTFDSRLAYQSLYVQQNQVLSLYGLQDRNAPLPVQANALVQGSEGRRMVSDLRWNSASITYRVDSRLLSILRARSLSIALQASNLALWTNYSGRDPGVNSAIYSEVSEDDGSLPPRPRTFVLDFRLGL